VVESPVAIADRLAERLIAAVPQRLGPARTQGDRNAVYRLRYQTVVEMGWAKPEEMPDGIERDEDDDRAVLVCAHDGDELAGTARVVLPREARPLPLEREFELEVESRETVEIGRLVILPRLRGDARHGLLLALFAQCWLEMRMRGFSELICAAPQRLIDVYRSLGFTVIPLNAPREHWGEERFPVRFDVIGSVPEPGRILGGAGKEAATTG
jgi:GNAT superfamily N-acetyltransferase